MELTVEEEAMLAGKMGPAVKWAISTQLAVGDYFQASRFQPVTQAQLVVDMEVMGEAGRDFIQEMAESGARFRVPAMTDTQCGDHASLMALRQDEAMVADQLAVAKQLALMGALDVRTNVPFQTLYPPHLREPLAWADTGSICFANSVCGARSNFEAGAASLAAALTGRVPQYGFHLDRHRIGTKLVEVDVVPQDAADWGALGAVIGLKAGNYWEVPVINRLPMTATSDQLKQLANALASFGSIAMFGVLGQTPEASSEVRAFGGQMPPEPLMVTRKDLAALYARFSKPGAPADVVVFDGPQQSLQEIQYLAALLEGRRVHPNTCLLIVTSLVSHDWAGRLGYLDIIEKAGGVVLSGLTFWLMGLEHLQSQFGWQTVVTNSAKVANIIGYVFDPVLLPTADCIRSAVAGQVVERV